jgi:hypothetical protein
MSAADRAETRMVFPVFSGRYQPLPHPVRRQGGRLDRSGGVHLRDALVSAQSGHGTHQ